MAGLVTKLKNSSRVTAYHACASFLEERVETGNFHPNGNPKYKYRVKENAGWVRSLWLDLDCGEGKDLPNKQGKIVGYATQKLAVAALVSFVRAAGLPSPTLVNSGYGVHAYWALDTDLTAAQWLKLAALWRAVVDHFGIIHDTSCTTDVVRVLRPVGSTNWKYGDRRDVKLLGPLREQIPVSTMVRAVKSLVSEYGLDPIVVPTSRPKIKSTINSDLSVAKDYPPADADVMATHCKQVSDFREAQGSVEEPIWYAMLGLVKHAVNGPDVCHAWSAGDPTYEYHKTQRKIDQWTQGPTTCAKLNQLNPAACAGCPHASKVVSPIQLGVVTPESVPIEDEVEAPADGAPEAEDIPEIPVSMQDKFAWNGKQLCAYLKDDDGVRAAIPICNSYMFARQSHRRNVAGEQVVHMVWVVRDKPGNYREFEIAGDAIGVGGRELFASLGNQGVVALTGGKKAMEIYVTDWFSALRAGADEVQSYTTFGWQKEGFLLGTSLLKEDGTIQEVRLQGDAIRYSGAFEPSGDLDTWKEGINRLYNRPHHEQFQWMLGTGFGAPLVKLMGGGMAGCVINGYSTETGKGKSTAGKLALGMYGNPEKLAITKQQITSKGLFAFCGLMKSLPVLLDEVTNAKGYELSELVYTFSQGTGRIGAMSDGSLRSNVYEWATLMATTSNQPVHTTLAANRGDSSPEIARVFEYKFTGQANQMGKEEADELIPELFQCSGIAGRVYMQYVVSHQKQVAELMKNTRILFNRRANARTEERYWAAGSVAVITGMLIAKKLGLISFNVNALMDWAINQMHAMRDQNKDTSIDITEHFGTMLNDLSPGFLVTDREGDARTPNSRAVVIHQPRSSTLMGRVINATNELFLPIAVVRKWCSDNRVDYRHMAETLQVRQWASVGSQPYALGKGTADYATAPSRCFKVDLALVGSEVSGAGGVALLSRVK
jgi:hypothetical protein